MEAAPFETMVCLDGTRSSYRAELLRRLRERIESKREGVSPPCTNLCKIDPAGLHDELLSFIQKSIGSKNGQDVNDLASLIFSNYRILTLMQGKIPGLELLRPSEVNKRVMAIFNQFVNGGKIDALLEMANTFYGKEYIAKAFKGLK